MFARVSVIALAGLLASCAHTQPVQITAPATPQQWAQVCKPWDKWDKPTPAFHIHGETYYVGTCGITAILVAGGDGHVLIDTGTAKGADVVMENMRTLGLDPIQISFLLHSHEHFDHVGGFAKMQEASGATIVASKIASSVIATGKAAADDPQFGMHDPMQPALVEADVSNGERVYSGDTTFTAIETPGHTPGALSWQWQSCDGDDCKWIVYADSLSPVSSDSYRFSAHPEYVRGYREGLQRLRAVECDILLTPHPSASFMLQRAATGEFIGGMTCADYADAVERRLNDRLAKEAEQAND